MGKHCGSMWCWGTPEVTVIGQGEAGRREWISPGCSPQRGEAVLFYLSLTCTSFAPLPADGTLSLAGCLKRGSTGRKEAEAAGAEINTVLLSTGQLVWPHQALPGAPLPTKPMGRCSQPSESEMWRQREGWRCRRCEVGAESISAPGFSSSLDTSVGQLPFEQAKRLEKSWVC